MAENHLIIFLYLLAIEDIKPNFYRQMDTGPCVMLFKIKDESQEEVIVGYCVWSTPQKMLGFSNPLETRFWGRTTTALSMKEIYIRHHHIKFLYDANDKFLHNYKYQDRNDMVVRKKSSNHIPVESNHGWWRNKKHPWSNNRMVEIECK